MSENNINNGTTNIQKLEDYNPYKLSLAVNAALRNPLNGVTTNAHILSNDNGHLNIGRANLRKWLGKTFRVVITDGRILVGFFNCTDKDANIVLSMCAEYLVEGKDARILGNVMIPGNHIVSISVDLPKINTTTATTTKSENLKTEKYTNNIEIVQELTPVTATATAIATTATTTTTTAITHASANLNTNAATSSTATTIITVTKVIAATAATAATTATAPTAAVAAD